MPRSVMPPQPPGGPEGSVRHFQDRFIEHGFVLVRFLVIDQTLEKAAGRKLVGVSHYHGLAASEQGADRRLGWHLRCFVDDAQVEMDGPLAVWPGARCGQLRL